MNNVRNEMIYVPVKVDVDGTGNEVYAVIDIYRDSEDFTKATILGYRTLDVNNSSLDELNVDTSAIVMGNIKSKSVQINNGAVIEGMCNQCYAEVNPTSFFEELKKMK